MTLWVDIGNTRIKCAEGVPGEMTPVAAIAWRSDSAQDQLKAHIGARRPAQTVVSCVAADTALDQLRAALDSHGLPAPHVYRQPTADLHGLRCGYRDRTQLGVDRWFATLGAWSRYGRALCVVDLGTAGTADLVDASGQHLGGCIFAGVRTQRHALATRTAQLPEVEHVTESVFSDNTETALAVGTRLSVAATVERAWDEAEQRIGGSVQCCLTGGGVEEVEAFLRRPVTTLPTLVFDGLAIAHAAEHS